MEDYCKSWKFPINKSVQIAVSYTFLHLEIRSKANSKVQWVISPDQYAGWCRWRHKQASSSDLNHQPISSSPRITPPFPSTALSLEHDLVSLWPHLAGVSQAYENGRQFSGAGLLVVKSFATRRAHLVALIFLRRRMHNAISPLRFSWRGHAVELVTTKFHQFIHLYVMNMEGGTCQSSQLEKQFVKLEVR